MMSCNAGVQQWCRQEFSDIQLGDQRLNERFFTTAACLLQAPDSPINKASGDWATAKGAYRFFGNKKVVPKEILRPHRQEVDKRLAAHSVVLAVQDTVALNYHSKRNTIGLGSIGSYSKKQGGTAGLFLHHSVAFTVEGTPLGILHQKIWARQEDQSRSKTYRSRPIAAKESSKWLESLDASLQGAPNSTDLVTVCDREGDIFEMFWRVQKHESFCLVRASRNRTVETDDDEVSYLWDYMATQPLAGKQTLELPNDGQKRTTTVEIRFAPVCIKPPSRNRVAKNGGADYEAIDLFAVWVKEPNPPDNREALEWLLLTNHPVETLAEALEKVSWYKVRWLIEIYHKILKTSFRVESSRLNDAKKLERYITLIGILAFRLQQLTMLARSEPETPSSVVLSPAEWKVLGLKLEGKVPKSPPTTREAVRMIARLGGFLARKSDGEPGVLTLWRGWQRLQDFSEVFAALTPNTCG